MRKYIETLLEVVFTFVQRPISVNTVTIRAMCVNKDTAKQINY